MHVYVLRKQVFIGEIFVGLFVMYCQFYDLASNLWLIMNWFQTDSYTSFLVYWILIVKPVCLTLYVIIYFIYYDIPRVCLISCQPNPGVALLDRCGNHSNHAGLNNILSFIAIFLFLSHLYKI